MLSATLSYGPLANTACACRNSEKGGQRLCYQQQVSDENFNLMVGLVTIIGLIRRTLYDPLAHAACTAVIGERRVSARVVQQHVSGNEVTMSLASGKAFVATATGDRLYNATSCPLLLHPPFPMHAATCPCNVRAFLNVFDIFLAATVIIT